MPQDKLTLPAQCISKDFIKIKINFDFYFLCGSSKAFIKASIKSFEAPQRSAKIKI